MTGRWIVTGMPRDTPTGSLAWRCPGLFGGRFDYYKLPSQGKKSCSS